MIESVQCNLAQKLDCHTQQWYHTENVGLFSAASKIAQSSPDRLTNGQGPYENKGVGLSLPGEKL